MKNLRVAACALNQTPLDWPGNLRRILEAINTAKDADVDLLCLPELCITGYGCDDTFHAGFVAETALDLLADVAQYSKGLVLAVGLPFMHHHALFNTAALVAGGEVLGLVAKQHLAGDGVHYDPRWFKPWTAGVATEARVNGRNVPFGDLLFDVGGLHIGFEICEDAWVATRPGARLAKYGADILLNPSASHFAFGKGEVRERFVVEGSRAFGVTYLYANLVGNEAGRVIYDGGCLIASDGQLVARGPRLSLSEVELTTAVVDVDLTRTAKARTASFRPELSAFPGLVRASYAWPRRNPEPSLVMRPTWEDSAYRKEEELARAVSLGLFDYMRKSGAHGFVVSASGGADSSAVACLVHLAARRALKELGAATVAERLAHVPRVEACLASPESLTYRLLTTLYQGSENSSDATRSAARVLCESIGARHHDLDVQPLIDGYIRTVEDAVADVLTWEHDDVVLQNIQARVRGPSAWLFANLEQKLLLATSNRSEAALGYATMDGDTCGGLSPIAGIDKAFLRTWLRWLETSGPVGLGSIPALSVVNSQASTPELRPAEAEQTSEEDLMPFWLLDRIERHAVRDRRSPRETLRLLESENTGLECEALIRAIARFFKLFAQNQWKRERYAPSFHLDDENLDPKTWFRFPILSGRFERELEELYDES
jgi:NAD+ synthase (glutamine-hydrolysing)